MTTATHEPLPHTTTDDAWCTSTPKRTTGGGLRSVGTALDVLECFAVDSALGVSDVARRLGVAKSTAHRVLTTLAGRGFVPLRFLSNPFGLFLSIIKRAGEPDNRFSDDVPSFCCPVQFND